MAEKTYYTMEPAGKLKCSKCNAFPVELPVCPKCGFIYVPEELALGKVLTVERSLEDK